MFYLFFLFAFLLAFCLILSAVKSGRFRVFSKVFRIAVVSVSLGVFGYFFIKKSLNPFVENSLSVQVVNKLPFPLDFYVIKLENVKDPDLKFKTVHLGNIRNDFYRIEYLKMENSDQFWIAAFMGKKNLVYFSQHSVPNKNENQVIEVRNYLIQSSKLAEIAKSKIEELKLHNMKSAIWITLDFLLLFLNLVLLLRKAK